MSGLVLIALILGPPLVIVLFTLSCLGAEMAMNLVDMVWKARERER